MIHKNPFMVRLGSIILSFLKLGLIAFGGPAAAYAMMHKEFVLRSKWLTEDQYFKFLGLANLVPGPNATELAMLIGYHQAGWWGLFTAGICYILPAMAIVLLLSWIYLRYGALPALEGVLYGIKPVVVAIIVHAMWAMIRPRLKNYLGLIIAFAACAAYLLGVSPVLLLLSGGLVKIIHSLLVREKPFLGLLPVWSLLPWLWMRRVLGSSPFDIYRLFFVFLKAGALMLGSGYVLLAFIHDDLVVRLGWLTESQMADAIAVGQMTPGPLSTTATFVGYLLGGFPAALTANFAMFLPSFLITILVVILMDRVLPSGWATIVIEGVSFAALGLMAGVAWEIAQSSIVNPLTGSVALVAILLMSIWDVNSLWLIFGGGVVGWLSAVLFT